MTNANFIYKNAIGVQTPFRACLYGYLPQSCSDIYQDYPRYLSGTTPGFPIKSNVLI